MIAGYKHLLEKLTWCYALPPQHSHQYSPHGSKVMLRLPIPPHVSWSPVVCARISMRVLMLSWEYTPHIIGGLGRHVTDLLPALADQGDTSLSLSLITPRLDGGATSDRVASSIHIARVPSVSTPGHSFPAFVAKVNQELEQAAHKLRLQTGDFDLIHTHDWLTAAAAVRLKQQWQVPLVVTFHATERGRGRGSLHGEHATQIDHIEQWLAAEAQRLVVCSHYMASQLISYFRTPPEKLAVIPNAVYVTPNPFTAADERLAFRRRFADDDEQLAFFIGRIVDEKGVHVLLEAWARVCGQTPGRLVFAGVGPSLDACKAHAQALGLTNRVIFTGKISDQERECLYRVADVAVFPSIYEPFGIVALEAMAAGCPVVVSQTGGLQEIVRLHETGITVFPNHIDSLTWGLLHTLHNPHWSRARAANALLDVQRIYSWHNVAQETTAIYQRALAEQQVQHAIDSVRLTIADDCRKSTVQLK